MRVIGGQLRGRSIRSPKGKIVRPTTDRVREAIFNRLEHRFWSRGGLEAKRVLDLFAGTGALGIEALSRGAELTVFVEGDRSIYRALRENLARLGLLDRAKCILDDIVKNNRLWEKIFGLGPFDIIFADPPYKKQLTHFIVERVNEYGLLKSGGILVIEEGIEKKALNNEKTDGVSRLTELDSRRYGNTMIRMWECVHNA